MGRYELTMARQEECGRGRTATTYIVVVSRTIVFEASDPKLGAKLELVSEVAAKEQAMAKQVLGKQDASNFSSHQAWKPTLRACGQTANDEKAERERKPAASTKKVERHQRS